jgi:hypothetical protein
MGAHMVFHLLIAILNLELQILRGLLAVNTLRRVMKDQWWGPDHFPVLGVLLQQSRSRTEKEIDPLLCPMSTFTTLS